jgi:Ulp1 family protease
LPQQKDGYACGVFVSAFANLLTDDIPLEKFHQGHENNFRRKLCLDILNQRLSYQDNPI